MTKYPRAGGAAVFAERAFKKPMLSFLVGFSMLAAGLTSAAGLSLAFTGNYLSTFINVSLLNARGIKESLRINVGMTLIELTGLVIVMVAGAVIAYYAFVGFETSANMAKEMQNPGRSDATALFGSLLVAGLVYVGVGLAADMAMPPAELAASTGALLTMIMTSRLI